MRSTRLATITAGALTIAVLAASVSADVRLPHIIGTNMVLQSNVPLPIWGWADPGEEVTVTIKDRQGKATADAKGHWMVRLEALPAGGPLEMTVAGKNRIQLTNILVGEVWLGSGQSNMEMTVASAAAPKKEMAAADYPKIRLFLVPKVAAGEPMDNVAAEWQVCSPATVGPFSAALYYFGRELHKELNVPLGLIASSWGGTRIEPWTPPEGFADSAALKDYTARIEAAGPKHKAEVAKALSQYEAWLTKARHAVDAGEPVPTPPEWPAHPVASNAQPTGLYNGMIHPLIPFAIRGAIWYQGEANWPDGEKYTEKMRALISGWRKVWGEGEFPFYYVQIAPFDRFYEGEALPRLWEAQAAAMAIPNTGMIVTTDIGNLEDIHPKDKQEVGRRLALWALAKTYGHSDLVCASPLYKSMSVEGSKVRLAFDNVGGGLASRDGKPLNWFEIAGEDRKFVPAEAEIDGTTVVVSSDKVQMPVAVRFGWSRTAQPNLMNKEGLPASPFRTDRW